MRNIVWPVILVLSMSLILVVSGLLYGNTRAYLESNWATTIVWLVIPIILISIIIVAEDPEDEGQKKSSKRTLDLGSGKRPLE